MIRREDLHGRTNTSAPLTPQYYYTPANTHIDLFGLDPYPVQTNVSNDYDLNIVNLAVKEAEAIGIPQKDLVPVYQAFGGVASYILPTATQEGQILSRWGSLLANPAFDYAYSWGVQLKDTALSDDFGASKGVRRSQRRRRRSVVRHVSGQWRCRGERIRQHCRTPGDRQQHGFQLGNPRV